MQANNMPTDIEASLVLDLCLHPQVTDLHRHLIDHLTIPSRQRKGVLRRVADVFDCWFESGARKGGNDANLSKKA